MEGIKRTELDAIIELLDEVIDNYGEGVEYGEHYKQAQKTACKALELVEHIFYGSFGNKYVITEVIPDGDEEGDEDDE